MSSLELEPESELQYDNNFVFNKDGSVFYVLQKDHRGSSEQYHLRGKDFERLTEDINQINIGKAALFVEDIKAGEKDITAKEKSRFKDDTISKLADQAQKLNEKILKPLDPKDKVDINRLAGKYQEQVSVLQRLISFNQSSPLSIRESLLKLADLGILTVYRNDKFTGEQHSKSVQLNINQLVDIIVSVLSSVMGPMGLSQVLGSLKDSIDMSIKNMVVLGTAVSQDFKVLYESSDDAVMMFAYKFQRVVDEKSKAIKFIITFSETTYNVAAEIFAMSFVMNPSVYSRKNAKIIQQYLTAPLPEELGSRWDYTNDLAEKLGI